MAYQSHQANLYLEGDTATALRDITSALQGMSLDPHEINEPRAKLTASHEALMEKRRAQQNAARKKTPIDPVWLCATLSDNLPEDAIYIDEVTTHPRCCASMSDGTNRKVSSRARVDSGRDLGFRSV
jgi:thiamine pyrophosphate-dependent acetolactate synthase large subunit-like protein